MSKQPSLLQITKEDGTNVLLTSSTQQVQAVRNDAAFGSGKYYAYFSNGTREMIGGPGAGMISGGGTLNFIPKFTPNGTTVGDSSLFDNGNIGYGTVAPVSVAAFDIVSTTKGILIPRMTTAQRNLIPVGAATDGLLIYNTSTEKYNFWNQTLGIWESIDTSTGGDVSGSGTTNLIPRWTDGPNSILGDSIIRDNGTVAAVNRAVIATTTFAVQGADAGAVNYTFEAYNSTPTQTFGVRNDGRVGINTTVLGGMLNIYSSANNHLSLSIVGGLSNRYLLYLDSVTENANYVLNNANHLFYAGGGGGELILTIAGAGVTNGRVSIAPSGSANYLTNKFYAETSLANDMAIRGKTLGAGGVSDYAGYFEAVGAGTQNVGIYLSATGATKNYSIISAAGHISFSSLQTGNVGLASGDLYVDTAANVTANADLFVARKV